MALRFDTYCGLYCGACEVLRVNREGRLEEAALEWKMSIEDIRCQGCKSDVVSSYCRSCDIKTCAVSHGVGFCYECQNYPCARISAFRNDQHPHHSCVINNLEQIQEKGLESWLSSQEDRWRCPECGTRFYWYDDQCKACNSLLRNARAEDAELS